jgi:hypothetical protein
MNIKQTVATALTAVAAFGALTFMPANADTPDASAAREMSADVRSINPAETPQHLVWDMTYGDQAPAEADEPVLAELPQDQVRDLSVG